MNNTFKELIDDTDLTDVTLACDDHAIIKAHRLILSSNSAFSGILLVKPAIRMHLFT